METLTQKQADFLRILKKWMKKHQEAPTITELQIQLQKNGFLVQSKRSITQYLDALEQKGLIWRSGQARGIKIIEPMGEVLLNVPILGLANAGVATVFADEYQAGFLRLSKKILKKHSNIFALQVKGNSLNKANINGAKIEDGDWVIIDKDYTTPKNGDYVLSVIDGMANLKKFFWDKKNNQIVLSSESTETHSPIIIHPDDHYRINGKIIQVIKKPAQ